MIIYKITNLVTNKIYIGQTVMPLKRRWAVHKCAKRKSPLTSSIMKHGVVNFKIEEICKASSKEELAKLEIYYIRHFDCLYPKGYNLSTGGVSSSGLTPWNKGLKGLKAPKSAFKKGHKTWNSGQPQLSEETRKKQSLAKMGKRLSPATEFKAGAPSAFKGKKHSAEALVKISENGTGRRIVCVETGETFNSMLAAAAHYKIAHSYLQRLLKSGQTHKKTGLSFKFCDSKATEESK
jgi:group I intron endonuclease